MRKRQISPTPPSVPASGGAWLNVERAAVVEVTSEHLYYLLSFMAGTSGRGSPTNPSRLGIFKRGSVASFNSVFLSTIPFR